MSLAKDEDLKHWDNVLYIGKVYRTRDVEKPYKFDPEFNNLKKYEFFKKHGIRNVRVRPFAQKKATDYILLHLQQSINNFNSNSLLKFFLLGDMGSGKTKFISWIIGNVKRIYKNYPVGVLFTNSLKFNLMHLIKCRVIVIVTDDAIELQQASAYGSKENQDLRAMYYGIRHVFKDVTGINNALIICIFAAQRYKDLEVGLRKADITIVKSTFSDPKENELIRAMLKPQDYHAIKRATTIRDFGFHEYGSYYAYTGKDIRWSGFSQIPNPSYTWEEIKISPSEIGMTDSDLISIVMIIRQEFYKRYGIKMKWEDIVKLIDWKLTKDALMIKIKRHREKVISIFDEKMIQLIENNKYYKKKLGRISK